VDINLTIIGQTIAMIVFVAFCMRFVWPPLVHALDERRKSIADGLAAAENGQKKLEEAQAKFEETVHESREQAAEIVQQAERRAREIIEEAKIDAVAEGERLIAQARAEIAQEATRARDALRGDVAAIALSGARQLLEREVDPSTHQQLLDKLAAEL
jgi:F-type H+-transporting ATPase subunit b